MKLRQTITLEWWNDKIDDEDDKYENDKYEDALMEAGMQRASSMIQQGYVEGALTEIVMDKGLEVEFNGYWKLETQ